MTVRPTMRNTTKRRSPDDDTDGSNYEDTSAHQERNRKGTLNQESITVLGKRDTQRQKATDTYSLNSEVESKNETTAAVLQLLNLKPLRDLARNFDIDIASCLNDYLTELDHDGLLSSTPSAFPPPATMQNDNDMLPNFAQAALLLQNSSGVYSRKVEYLHSLVYKTLHSLIDEMNKHSKKHTSMNKPGGGQQQRGMDEAIYNFQQFDSDLQFLLLDDVLPIDVHGTKINLKQSDLNIDEVNDNNAIAGTTTTNDTNNNNNNGNNTTVLNSTRLSIGLVLDDQCDLTNNANGPSSRSLNATSETMGNGMNTSLRLMNGSCHVHAGTGTLLMPGTSTAMQPMFQQYDKKVDVHAADFNNVTDQTDISMQERDYCNDDVNNENDDNHVVFENDDYDNDDDDEGVGFELNGHNDDQQIALHLHQGITSSINEHPIIQDPWEMLLDPHDNANSKVKPMKFGKTIRIPFDCGELPSYAVTGSKSRSSKKRKNPNDSVSKVIHQKNGKNSSVNEDNKWWNKCIATHSYNATISNLKEDYARRKSEGTINKIDNGNDDETFVTNVERKPVMHELPIHGHLFQNEFQYIAQENQAFKTMEKRKKKAQDKINNDKNNDMVVDSAAAALSKERFNDMYEGDNDSVGVNEDVVDFGYGNDYGDDDDDQDGGDNFNYDDNNDDEFDNAFSNHENESKYESTTFEELCRAHLKEFAKGAAKFAVETDLTKRVSSWQEKLAVILEEEDSRNEFNIGTYSNKIIAGVQKQTEKDKNPNSKKSNTISFASITKNQNPYEVSRTFLASLMLCNSENVVFCNGTEDDVSHPDSLELELLKLGIDSPMDTYLAPSLVN